MLAAMITLIAFLVGVIIVYAVKFIKAARKPAKKISVLEYCYAEEWVWMQHVKLGYNYMHVDMCHGPQKPMLQIIIRDRTDCWAWHLCSEEFDIGDLKPILADNGTLGYWVHISCTVNTPVYVNKIFVWNEDGKIDKDSITQVDGLLRNRVLGDIPEFG